jgi:hypothetical protein
VFLFFLFFFGSRQGWIQRGPWPSGGELDHSPTPTIERLAGWVAVVRRGVKISKVL